MSSSIPLQDVNDYGENYTNVFENDPAQDPDEILKVTISSKAATSGPRSKDSKNITSDQIFQMTSRENEMLESS